MNSINEPYNESLDEAANAIVDDNRSELRDCLKPLGSMDCATACLMNAWASDSFELAESSLQQALEYDPENEVAVAGLNWIHGIQELANSRLEAKHQAEEARLKAEEEARLKAEEEARLKAEEEVRAKAEEEARLQAEEEARLKAEEAARAKAEEEARLKAEEVARLQAEEEARIKAQEEVRIKAEAEERRKAEESRVMAEEAQAKAEEDARLKAQEEAKLKAEKEASLRAEEETREKAEEEARQKAEEEARQKAEEETRLKAEEDARLESERERQEELERHAEFERHAELERQAELEQSTKLERQAELKRKAEIEQQAEFEREEQSKAEQAASLAALSNSSLESNDDPIDTHSTAIESQIEEDVTALVAEVKQEVQSNQETDSTTVTSEVDAEKQVVLIIDDSPTVRMLVSLTLGKEGFEVIAAEDGVDALKILANQLPDIILTDINMPKLNGYKLCKFIKKHERTKSIPVVMLSGKDGVFDKMRGKLNGCDDFIVKPFESTELIAKVREILSTVATA